MNLQDYIFSMEQAKEYLTANNMSDLLEAGCKEEIPPKWADLARLHKLVRERKPFQILEFGSGFSTITMAYALKANWDEYISSLNDSTEKRCAAPRIVSIESAAKWQDNTQKKITRANLTEFTKVIFSRVTIAEYQGQLCHFYNELPDLVPDFVYLDGPDPATVEGSINGLSFQNSKRTVMAADILKFESTLLPGFFMIVDGRTNNARFLQRMLARSYDIQHSDEADVTTFEIKEPRLGRKNIFGWEAYTNSKFVETLS